MSQVLHLKSNKNGNYDILLTKFSYLIPIFVFERTFEKKINQQEYYLWE